MKTVTVYPAPSGGFESYEVWWTEDGALAAVEVRAGHPREEPLSLYAMQDENENRPASAAISIISEDLHPDGNADKTAVEAAEMLAGLGNFEGGLAMLGEVVDTLPAGRALIPMKQAAPLLGIGESTLRRLVAAGEVAHRRLGGSVFLLYPDDFDAIIEDAAVEKKDWFAPDRPNGV